MMDFSKVLLPRDEFEHAVDSQVPQLWRFGLTREQAVAQSIDFLNSCQVQDPSDVAIDFFGLIDKHRSHQKYYDNIRYCDYLFNFQSYANYIVHYERNRESHRECCDSESRNPLSEIEFNALTTNERRDQISNAYNNLLLYGNQLTKYLEDPIYTELYAIYQKQFGYSRHTTFAMETTN